MNCAFCEQPAEHVCSWPTVKRVAIPAKGLSVGDTIFDSRGHEGEVISVTAATFVVQPRFGTLATRKKELSFSLLTSVVHVDRLLPCGSPVCEAHFREVGDDRHYCAAHWMAWEQVA